MKRLMLVVVAGFLAVEVMLVGGGCQDSRQTEIDRIKAENLQVLKNNTQLTIQIQTLEKDNQVAYNTLATFRDETEGLNKQLGAQAGLLAKQGADLRASYDALLAAALKREIELRNKLATAEKLAGDLADLPKSSSVKAQSARVKTPGEVKPMADLERQIVSLQAHINLEQSKVMNLIKATVDLQMIPPPNGYIRNGQVYSRVLHCQSSTSRWLGRDDYVHTHDSSCYHYVPAGPAVKAGDFRTEHDKSRAITDAKASILPLYEELKILKQELADLKSKP